MRHVNIILIVLAAAFCLAGNISAETERTVTPVQHNDIEDRDGSIVNDPSIKVLGEYYSNSSDFRKKSIGADFEFMPDTSFRIGTGYSYSDFSQKGFEDITRNRVYLEGEKQVSEKIGVVARISDNYYDNDNNNINGGLFLRYSPGTNLYTEFSFRHFDIIDTVLPFNNVIYSYVVTIGSIDRNIQSDDYKMFLLYFPSAKVSFAGEVIYGDYSDGNMKRSLMFEAGYKLSNKPHFRYAYNYFYLDLDKAAPLTQGGEPNESAYWDPIHFDTHTLRIEFREDFSGNLTVGADGALSYSFDSDWISRTAFLYVTYRLREQMTLRLDARWFDQHKGVDRLGKTDRFRAENYSVIMQYRF